MPDAPATTHSSAKDDTHVICNMYNTHEPKLGIPRVLARRRATKQAEGRRGSEGVYEKWLEIRHFRVFPYPEGAELTLSWAAVAAGDQKGEEG